MSARLSSIRAALLAWYRENRRDLPWRRTRDPYAIWVSEVMLQQTRVETVKAYYRRFLERFPTPTALDAASEDDVLAAWSGLGYYRRARLLKAGVREVVARYGGEVPTEREARRSLPGVGPYTAGAIGSIAFGREEPIVDGNVARVFTRLENLASPLGRSDTDRALWALAEALVAGPDPGDLNQAVMELGATVCTPRAPRCDACPIAPHCEGRAAGRAADLPTPRAKRAPRRVALAAVVARRGTDGVWLLRGEGSLFGGLFAVPTAEGHGREAARRALREAELRARLDTAPVGILEHVLSHRRLRVEVWQAKAAAGQESDRRRLLTPATLGSVGVAKVTRRILSAVLPLDAGETLELPLSPGDA